MHIYSDTALIFLEKVRAFSLCILKSEMGIPFNRKRLLFNNKYYPLDFVIFEHPKILGQYDPNYYQIKINKLLSYRCNDHHLKNIIRHELAHYLTHIIFGTDPLPHGKEFLSVCRRFNFGEEIYSATIELNKLTDSMSSKNEDKVIQKVKKLLRLANSDNQNEAELATAKANELIKSHNIKFANNLEDFGEETALVRVLNCRRVNGKLQAIYKIMHHFFVAPVFSYGERNVCIELIGEKHNVACAEYVATFLSNALENLYDQSRLEKGISGIRAKNSFMLGAADGFIKKISNEEVKTHDTKELALLQIQISKHFRRVYPKTRTQKSQRYIIDEKAKSLGFRSGQSLSVSPALTKRRTQKFLK